MGIQNNLMLTKFNELESSKYSEYGYIVIMERSSFSVRELFIPFMFENEFIQSVEFNILSILKTFEESRL